MPAPPLDSGSQPQSVRALAGLRALVLSGSIAPGERLAELQLVERLGLSRTPVRAALAQLARDGLLEPLPSGGYAARRFTLADVIDTIEIRGAMEGLACRLAAERGVEPARVAEGHALLDRIDAALGPDALQPDVGAYADLNTAFHTLLAQLPGSDAVRMELERATALPFAMPSALLDAQAELPRFHLTLIAGQRHHRDLLDAIAARQGARAEALAQEHARLASRNVAIVLGDRRLVRRVPGLSLVSGEAGAEGSGLPPPAL